MSPKDLLMEEVRHIAGRGSAIDTDNFQLQNVHNLALTIHTRGETNSSGSITNEESHTNDDENSAPKSAGETDSVLGETATSRRGSEVETLSALKAKRFLNASFFLMEAFPKPVALAMLEGRKVEPMSKKMVSVFFSDIPNFAILSSQMDCGKVSDLLKRLFDKFDALADLHRVQKVDVINDLFFAATNFSEEQGADHATRLARFALDAVRAAEETTFEDVHEIQDGAAIQSCRTNSIRIRVGLHSGPVSGSVIGGHNGKYTLLGDTVNVASRMCSTATPGRVQCSEAAATLVTQQSSSGDNVRLAAREGGTDVKGKGHMQTYWVTMPEPECAAAAHLRSPGLPSAAP